MTFLSPLSLLWLGAIPALVWLWRLASSNRQTRVASLIPFEHLLKRTSTRRRRVVVNWLFWLQAAALAAAALALAQPVLRVARARTILAILDTSASMTARSGGSSAFDRAQRALAARISRKRPTDQVLLMTTAPAMPLNPEPLSDGAALERLVNAQRARDLGGQLSATARLGAALLGASPDEVWIATDEPAPEGGTSPGLRWMGVGRRLPNLAIVGIDALGPLCDALESHVVVTLQSFAGSSQAAQVLVRQQGRQLAQASVELAPGIREPVALPLPPGTRGVIEVALAASPDALAADNRAWAVIQPAARLPVAVKTSHPSVTATVSRWLGACTALAQAAEAPPSAPRLVITDRAEEAAAASGPSLLLAPPLTVGPTAGHWMVAPDHPIGFYLPALDTVAAAVMPGHAEGAPVISTFVNGRKAPVVTAEESRGQRRVALRVDVSGQEASVPITLVFFNSLRWLMGDLQPGTTRDVLAVGGWAPGMVTIRRPDGSTSQVPSVDGAIRDEAAAHAGLYRLSQGAREVARVMNFLDPLESNTLDRPATWSPGPAPPAAAPAPARAAAHPLAPSFMLAILLVLAAEWWLYSAPRSGFGVRGSGIVRR